MPPKIMNSNSKNNVVPPIEITLTSFIDDENGEISSSTEGIVKIDGEEERPKQTLHDSSMVQSTIVRNLFTLAVCQFLLFMSFDSVSNLQSTINTEIGVGTKSLAVLYGALTLSSFCLPTILIKNVGCKKTMVFAMIGFCPYILGNLYPSWSTLIPTAVICGLASGPLLCARSTYLNRISRGYARLQPMSVEIMNVWFFSIFTTLQQNTEIWGNLMTYYVLQSDGYSELHAYQSNAGLCGSEFCNNDILNTNTTLLFPSNSNRYVWVSILTILAIAAALFTALFLSKLETDEKTEVRRNKITFSDLLATFDQMANFDQILLIPLSIYIGLVDGFYNADYSRAYIACAWDVPHVAAVSICYGIVSVLVDSVGAPCVLILGRAGLFFLAAIAHLAMFLALCLWRPDPVQYVGFFLIAGAHGIGNGVWMSQLLAFYGVLFENKEEAAFSCYYFLSSLGFLMAYSYSSYICTKVKLIILLVMLVMGLTCYLAVEIRILKKSLLELDRKRRMSVDRRFDIH